MGCIISGPLTAPELYGAAASVAGASLSIDRSAGMPAKPERLRRGTASLVITCPTKPPAVERSAQRRLEPEAHRCPPLYAVAASSGRIAHSGSDSTASLGAEGHGDSIMLWKRVGRAATATTTATTSTTVASSAIPYHQPPPPPSKPPRDRHTRPATLTRSPAPPFPAAADPEEDGEEGPAQLTRAVSSFGQNRMLTMFGPRLAAGAGWRR